MLERSVFAFFTESFVSINETRLEKKEKMVSNINEKNNFIVATIFLSN